MANTTNSPRKSPFGKTNAPPDARPHPATESPAVDKLVRALASALPRVFGTSAFPNPDGWKYEGITARRVAGHFGACATFTKADRTLLAIVMPTSPDNENPYYRTERFDMAYIFEGVPEEQRSDLWSENRALVDKLAAWLEVWERSAAS